MASLTPVRILGITGRTGEVAVGKEAGLVILGGELHVAATIAAGRVVYRRETGTGGGSPLAASSS
jgi:N-acetylglucosamine-6-phosphate deacetylase